MKEGTAPVPPYRRCTEGDDAVFPLLNWHYIAIATRENDSDNLPLGNFSGGSFG
jgi:hypothetical protein